jgi:hypothetical protein
MVIAMHAYYPIKQLCGYCRSNHHAFMLMNAETVAIVSGFLSGLIFEFQRDCCRVKVSRSRVYVDLPGNLSTDNLMRILLNHNIINAADLHPQH